MKLTAYRPARLRRRVVPVLAALAFALAVAACGGSSSTSSTSSSSPSPPSPPPSEPVASVFVAVDGSDAGKCSTSAPCRSFDRAYRVARPGEVVEVAGGSYPAQTVEPDPSKTSSEDVVFRPAAGAVVTLGCPSTGSNCLQVLGSHVTFRGMRTATLAPLEGHARQGGVAFERGSNDVTFEDLDAGHVWMAGRNSTILGGDYGPDANAISTVSAASNLLIDGARFHDFLSAGQHMECLGLWWGKGVTIRNSRFETCEDFAILAKHYPEQAVIEDVTLENNFFSNPGGAQQSTMVKFTSPATPKPCDRIVVRYNTVVDGGFHLNCSGTGNVFESNALFNFNGCGAAGWEQSHNVIETGVELSSACGRQVPDLGLVDRSSGDLHLASGSPAVDAGNPSSHPAEDIDGQERPQGDDPDAGADEG